MRGRGSCSCPPELELGAVREGSPEDLEKLSCCGPIKLKSLAYGSFVFSLIRAVGIELEKPLAILLKDRPLAVDARWVYAEPFQRFLFEAAD